MSEQRIIVIEDQEDLAALYKASLTQAGYEVINAYTGEEGVAEFRANGADAVLLDMTLPEMHGITALQEIRALNARVPILVVTGEANEDTRQQSERLGVHEYLSKPVDYDELIAAIRRTLEQTPDEDYEIVTLRLPSRIIACLSGIDTNLGRAVTRVCDELTKGQQADRATS